MFNECSKQSCYKETNPMVMYHVIKIYCSQCKILLYKYQKGGSGRLVKCYTEKIVKDFTNGDLKCPQCEQPFAREAMIRGKPAHKIIQGKVFVK
jgi:hypothetical protein